MTELFRRSNAAGAEESTGGRWDGRWRRSGRVCGAGHPGPAPCSNILCPICCCRRPEGSLGYEALRLLPVLPAAKRLPNGGCPGACSESGLLRLRSPASIISTRPTASSAWALKRGQGEEYGPLPLLLLFGPDDRRRAGATPTCAGSRSWGRRVECGFYEAVDFTAKRVRQARPTPSCAAIWRTMWA